MFITNKINNKINRWSKKYSNCVSAKFNDMDSYIFYNKEDELKAFCKQYEITYNKEVNIKEEFMKKRDWFEYELEDGFSVNPNIYDESLSMVSFVSYGCRILISYIYIELLKDGTLNVFPWLYNNNCIETLGLPVNEYLGYVDMLKYLDCVKKIIKKHSSDDFSIDHSIYLFISNDARNLVKKGDYEETLRIEVDIGHKAV
jgi:hypothetical protein